MGQKEEILEQIDFMKTTSKQELYTVIFSAIPLYLRSIITFGINSRQAKENIEIIKEMRAILKEEKSLITTIEEHIDSIDLDETVDIIDSLDKLNDDTYLSYDSIFSDIEVSCELKDKTRAIRKRSSIDSLITNKSYQEKVKRLVNKKL